MDSDPHDTSPIAEDYVDPALADLGNVRGTIGVRDVRDLVDLASRIADIGRASHSELGDRIVVVAGRVSDLAREARRRLADDVLPPDAGTDAQRERRIAADDDIVPPA